MRVYFDNAATTPLYPEVIQAMSDAMMKTFGNPSSVHHYGREARVLVEKSRKLVAEYLNISPAEIFFNSGGTEGNNAVIQGCISDLGIQHIITSPIEHPAVLNTVKKMAEKANISVSVVSINGKGHINLEHLEELLQGDKKTLVTLMHANNEISNLLPINNVSKLCRQYGALFHSDMVQTIGHYKIDLQAIDLDFVTASSHKFHGPKGVGFLYVNGNTVAITPLFSGGSQERNMRPGTENLMGIVGLGEALIQSYKSLETKMMKVKDIKAYFIQELRKSIPGVTFLGDSEEKGLYTILNVVFPKNPAGEMLINNLDIDGIAASMGSACSSGTTLRSTVVKALGVDEELHPIRFSFSHMNTREEVNYCIDMLKKHF